MCHCVYLASDCSLPLIPFDANIRAFNVYKIEEHDPVCERLQKPYKVYLGSRTSCSCGLNFYLDELIESNFDFSAEYTPDEIASQQLNYDLEKKCLVDYFEYLRQALQYSDLEWYSCWSGDEKLPPLRRDRLPASILDGEPVFVKNYLLEDRHYVYYEKALIV